MLIRFDFRYTLVRYSIANHLQITCTYRSWARAGRGRGGLVDFALSSSSELLCPLFSSIHKCWAEDNARGMRCTATNNVCLELFFDYWRFQMALEFFVSLRTRVVPPFSVNPSNLPEYEKSNLIMMIFHLIFIELFPCVKLLIFIIQNGKCSYIFYWIEMVAQEK